MYSQVLILTIQQNVQKRTKEAPMSWASPSSHNNNLGLVKRVSQQNPGPFALCIIFLIRILSFTACLIFLVAHWQSVWLWDPAISASSSSVTLIALGKWCNRQNGARRGAILRAVMLRRFFGGRPPGLGGIVGFFGGGGDIAYLIFFGGIG